MTQETVTETACRVLENLTVILQSGTFPGYMAAELAEARKFTAQMLDKFRLDQEAQTQVQSETNDQAQVAAAFEDLRYDFVPEHGPKAEPAKRKRGRPRKA